MNHLSTLPIYRLVGTHSGLLSVLTLPEGYLVRLRQDEVVEITAADGVVRWQSAQYSPAGTDRALNF
jgi:hypothetical protein